MNKRHFVEASNNAPLSAKQNKKRRVYSRKRETADFRSIILKAGSPDLITIIEAKLSLNKMLSLPGFIDWCEKLKYHFITLSWSSSEVKGGAGYTGVMTLSRFRPISTTFGFKNVLSDEARVITHEFTSFVHVSVYSPCTGYDTIKMESRFKFDQDLSVHIANLQKDILKPVICSGDLNVNPRRQDWHEKAFATLYKLREASACEHHPGCSPRELKSYYDLLNTTKLSNAWEELYPYSTEGMTWHPPSDPRGLKCWGQRLDHFLISPSFLNSKGKYNLVSMINMRGEGSSDHNALLLTLQLSGDIPSVFSLSAHDDMDILISNLDTHQSKLFKAVECPRVSMEICGKRIQVFLDTGAPFSIYNPPAIRLTGDEFLAKALPTGNQTNCSFSGATGGRVHAEQNYIMPFKVGDHSLKGCFVVLATHERNLPIFLFGQDILMGPLEGIAVIPDVKHQLDKISVYFGINWDTRHPCEAIVRIRYPPCLPPDVTCLVQDLDVELLEKYLPTISNIAPDHLFDTEPLEDDAFIFGGAARTKHVDNEETQDDFCLESEFEGHGFEDCPIPVVEMGIVFGPITSTLAADVLIDSGATLNLMSQEFVKQIVAADGIYFKQASVAGSGSRPVSCKI